MNLCVFFFQSDSEQMLDVRLASSDGQRPRVLHAMLLFIIYLKMRDCAESEAIGNSKHHLAPKKANTFNQAVERPRICSRTATGHVDLGKQ